MPRLAIVASFLLLLAGCAAPGEEPGAIPPEAEEARDARPPTGTFSLAPGSVTETWVDSIDLTIRVGVPLAPWDQQSPRKIHVNETVTAVLVEVTWDEPTMDIDAYAVGGPCPVGEPCMADSFLRRGTFHQASGGMPGQGDSPSRLFLNEDTLRQACESCDWTMGAWTQTAAAQVTATIYVTLFTGPVPEGFTAIGSA